MKSLVMDVYAINTCANNKWKDRLSEESWLTDVVVLLDGFIKGGWQSGAEISLVIVYKLSLLRKQSISKY